jgi:hypothetical protein
VNGDGAVYNVIGAVFESYRMLPEAYLCYAHQLSFADMKCGIMDGVTSLDDVKDNSIRVSV